MKSAQHEVKELAMTFDLPHEEGKALGSKSLHVILLVVSKQRWVHAVLQIKQNHYDISIFFSTFSMKTNHQHYNLLYKGPNHKTWVRFNPWVNPNQPPLDIFRDKSATRIGVAARFQEFFSLSFRAYFETKLVTSGCMVTKLRNF